MSDPTLLAPHTTVVVRAFDSWFETAFGEPAPAVQSDSAHANGHTVQDDVGGGSMGAGKAEQLSAQRALTKHASKLAMRKRRAARARHDHVMLVRRVGGTLQAPPPPLPAHLQEPGSLHDTAEGMLEAEEERVVSEHEADRVAIKGTLPVRCAAVAVVAAAALCRACPDAMPSSPRCALCSAGLPP